jgi:hypothetical protein
MSANARDIFRVYQTAYNNKLASNASSTSGRGNYNLRDALYAE